MPVLFLRQGIIVKSSKMQDEIFQENRRDITPCEQSGKNAFQFTAFLL